MKLKKINLLLKTKLILKRYRKELITQETYFQNLVMFYIQMSMQKNYSLKKYGLKINIYDEKKLKNGNEPLLGVGQGN